MQNTCQNCDCQEEKEEAKDACCGTGECECGEETEKEDICCGGCDCGV